MTTHARVTATVPIDLQDLLPAFLRNRRKELRALQRALMRLDFAELAHLSHRMKGVGHWYGFPDVSAIGAQIEMSAREQDPASLSALITRYRNYLRAVRITYGPHS